MQFSANADAPDRSLSGGWDYSGSAYETARLSRSCLIRRFGVYCISINRKRGVFVPKLEAYNNMVMQISGDESKKKTFKTFIDDVWQECMENSDKCLKTADKPKKPEKK